MENYKKIIGFEDYEISNQGNVKSLSYRMTGKEKVMKTRNHPNGYLVASLTKNKKVKKCYIHRLVMTAFVPNLDNKPQVNHINGIKTDNRVENLEWCTASENRKHCFDIGLQVGRKGEKHHKSKLTETKVLEIRESNLVQSEISTIYGISQSVISNIKSRQRWSHI